MIGRNLAPLFGHSCYHIWEARLAWGSKKQEGYWLLSSWHQASFRQAIPGEQLSGLIAPKKKDGEETNKLSAESVIYRLNDKNSFLYFFFFLSLDSLSLLPFQFLWNTHMAGWYNLQLWFAQWDRDAVISLTLRLIWWARAIYYLCSGHISKLRKTQRNTP